MANFTNEYQEKKTKMWMAAAHLATKTGYNNAIMAYEQQKTNFIRQLEINSGKSANNFMDELNNSIANELEGIELDKTLEDVFENLKQEFENWYSNLIIQGVDTSTAMKKLKDRFEDLVKRGQLDSKNKKYVNPENLYKNMRKDILDFLFANGLSENSILQWTKNVHLQQIENIDIQNNLMGYIRKLMLQILQGNELKVKTQHYKTSLKGYYKEELLIPAFNKVLSNYGIEATQTGSVTNEKGQQIKYDIILHKGTLNNIDDNDLSKMITRLDELQKNSNGKSSVQIFDTTILGGVQSKSWIAPWEDKNIQGNKKYLSFGHSEQLLPKSEEDKHYWHAGVYNVMDNLMSAIGINNFIYSTGSKIYWTSDLLNNFRKENYVLAFYWRKTEQKIVDSDVSAQLHSC